MFRVLWLIIIQTIGYANKCRPVKSVFHRDLTLQQKIIRTYQGLVKVFSHLILGSIIWPADLTLICKVKKIIYIWTGIMSKQRAKNNDQRAKSNEQTVKSNEHWVKWNGQREQSNK